MQFTIFYFLLVVAYVLGSLSSAILLARFWHLPDPREHGSGNPGATNILRSSGKQAALVVLVLDMLKGIIPVLLAKLLGLHGLSVALIGVAAVVGHIFPLFFKFKGGKGVATAYGVLLALSWQITGIAFVIWLMVVAGTRYVSLASLVSISVTPVFNEWIGNPHYFLALVLLIILIAARHHENIERLLDGTEHKIWS